jgi:hypothetical protein
MGDDDNSDTVAGWGAHALSASSSGSSGDDHNGSASSTSSSGGCGDASAVAEARIAEMKMLEMELNLHDGQTGFDDEDDGDGMLPEDSAAQPSVLANLQFLRQQLDAPVAESKRPVSGSTMLPSDFLAAHKERAAMGIEERWQQLEARFAKEQPRLPSEQKMSTEERRRLILWQNRWRLQTAAATAVHGGGGGAAGSEAVEATPAAASHSNQRQAKQVKARLTNARAFFSRTQQASLSSQEP